MFERNPVSFMIARWPGRRASNSKSRCHGFDLCSRTYHGASECCVLEQETLTPQSTGLHPEIGASS